MEPYVRTKQELQILQALPLYLKIPMTVRRLRDWITYYGEHGVYLSWSGGKDSTVLRHIIRQYWPNIESVFVDTGLEYPEIRQFVKSAQDRGEPVTILRPKMRFNEVIKKYGYPSIGKEVANAVYEARRSIANGKTDTVRVKKLTGEITTTRAGKSRYDYSRYRPLLDVDFVISDRCCDVMKKAPTHAYSKATRKVPILGTMAEESALRETTWRRSGCNAFDDKTPKSQPMSFWTEQDVLWYIKLNNVEIPSVYGKVEYVNDPEQIRLDDLTDETLGYEKLCTSGCSRTGCIFCGFGAHLEKGESRFERLKRTHPRQYEYCIGGGEYNENGLWQPNKDGLGMGHVFEVLNSIYGEGFIRY